MRDLLHQRSIHGRAGLTSADTTQAALLPNNLSHEDAENGIIYWEGHAWSSDGPFAGA
jgi:hypothetical protein